MKFSIDTKHKSSYVFHMSKLDIQTRVQILNMLVEGSSMRSISRITGTSINTVSKLLIEAGEACIEFHDENVRGLKSERIQCDEIWSFCYAGVKRQSLYCSLIFPNTEPRDQDR